MRSRVAPDHLVVWLAGVEVEPDEPRFLDDRFDADFSLRAWADRIRSQYAHAVLGTAHEGLLRTDGWWPAIRDIAIASRDSWAARSRVTTPAPPLAGQRAMARDVLESLCAADEHPWAGTAIDDAVLVVDELVVNVSQHGGERYSLDLLPGPSSVVIGVTDAAPDRLATQRDAGPTAPDGRGLAVVEQLASAWGQVLTPTTKTVWAQLPLWTTAA